MLTYNDFQNKYDHLHGKKNYITNTKIFTLWIYRWSSIPTIQNGVFILDNHSIYIDCGCFLLPEIEPIGRKTNLLELMRQLENNRGSHRFLLHIISEITWKELSFTNPHSIIKLCRWKIRTKYTIDPWPSIDICN